MYGFQTWLLADMTYAFTFETMCSGNLKNNNKNNKKKYISYCHFADFSQPPKSII